MKFFFSVITASLLFSGCDDATYAEPQESISIEPVSVEDEERSPAVYEVSDSLLTSIDSIVNRTDLKSKYYKKNDSTISSDEQKETISYQMLFDKKGGKLLKGITSRINHRYDLSSAAYFANDKLIK